MPAAIPLIAGIAAQGIAASGVFGFTIAAGTMASSIIGGVASLPPGVLRCR